MATEAKPTVNMFHSVDRDMASQPKERFRRAETFSGNDDLALQAFTGSEWLLGDAIQSLAAEILCDALNWRFAGLPP